MHNNSISKDPHAAEHATCDGWVYYTRIDYEEDDVRKIGHYAVCTPPGKAERVIQLDYSPYNVMTPDIFAKMVRANFPGRLDISEIEPDRRCFGPLSDSQIEALYAQRCGQGAAA